jgi:multiple sugar transport system substrate-binding protein
MKKTKILSISLILLLMFSIVVMAGGKQESSDKIDMSILGIGGWLPSSLAVEMSDLFAEYAKEKYGYDVEFSFQESPFSSLFQKAATSLATKSQEYNIIISDSQWLGAFAEPGWIVPLNDIIKDSPVLSKVEWADPIVKSAYMTYPDGSDSLYGLAQEADVLVLYVRKDMLEDPKERASFKAAYGYDLPLTFEDFIDIDMDQYEQISKFFTRSEDDFYGLAIQYSKEYDFMTGSLYPFIWSAGGEIWNPKTRDVYGILNTENNAKALETMVSLQKYAPPGVINYGIGNVVEAFTQGKVFSAFQWAAMGSAMIPDTLKGKVLIVPPPGYRMADGTVNRITSLGGQPWVINKFNDETHMQVAIQFMEWWYTKDTQLEFARRGGNPVNAEALNSPGFEDIQPWFKVLKYMLTEERARDFWHEPTYAEMLSFQQEEFTSFASGNSTDAMATLNSIAAEQQRILYEAGRTTTPPPAK